MTHPLSARLLLLAAAAALAASLVFAMIVAEHRDVDARPAHRPAAGATELRVDALRPSPAERLRAVGVAAGR